ncbi:MAG: hypothetical protein OXI61_14760 [Candidatus Poribacteria bacterium]|nr:hypothetical protein [Candidatus Poribacteria bacterium]
MNRTTTNGCLIVFDFYWLDEFSLLPELHAVTVFQTVTVTGIHQLTTEVLPFI